tara:strand:+ start:309 stop:482 length:174 start_codon:yes stop_codon:yes gene_type:complete
VEVETHHQCHHHKEIMEGLQEDHQDLLTILLQVEAVELEGLEELVQTEPVVELEGLT